MVGEGRKPPLHRVFGPSTPGSWGQSALSEKLVRPSRHRTFDQVLHALDTDRTRIDFSCFISGQPAQAGQAELGPVSPTGGYRRAVDGRKAFTASAPSRLLHRPPSACRSEVATASQPIIKSPHRML